MTLANGRSGLEGAVYLYLIHDCIILQKYENILEKLQKLYMSLSLTFLMSENPNKNISEQTLLYTVVL